MELGGAEHLVVNICKVMQEDLGHKVTILTSHHDPAHCFEETKPDGEKTKLYLFIFYNYDCYLSFLLDFILSYSTSIFILY